MISYDIKHSFGSKIDEEKLFTNRDAARAYDEGLVATVVWLGIEEVAGGTNDSALESLQHNKRFRAALSYLHELLRDRDLDEMMAKRDREASEKASQQQVTAEIAEVG